MGSAHGIFALDWLTPLYHSLKLLRIGVSINMIGEKGALVELLIATNSIPLAMVLLQHVLAEQKKGLLPLVTNIAGESHVGRDLGIDIQHALLVVRIAFAFLWSSFCFARGSFRFGFVRHRIRFFRRC